MVSRPSRRFESLLRRKEAMSRPIPFPAGYRLGCRLPPMFRRILFCCFCISFFAFAGIPGASCRLASVLISAPPRSSGLAALSLLTSSPLSIILLAEDVSAVPVTPSCTVTPVLIAAGAFSFFSTSSTGNLLVNSLLSLTRSRKSDISIVAELLPAETGAFCVRPAVMEVAPFITMRSFGALLSQIFTVIRTEMIPFSS